MNRQEKFDELVERMELPENTARRNPAVLSEADTAIAQNIADMRHYLTVLNDTSKSDICFTEKQFDKKYDDKKYIKQRVDGIKNKVSDALYNVADKIQSDKMAENGTLSNEINETRDNSKKESYFYTRDGKKVIVRAGTKVAEKDATPETLAAARVSAVSEDKIEHQTRWRCKRPFS